MTRLRIPHLLAAIGVCVVLGLAAGAGRGLTSAFPDAGVKIEGTFPRNGGYPGAPLRNATNLRSWGSWAGSNTHQGTITFGPFVAPSTLTFAISGYPTQPGNAVFLERTGSHERQRVEASQVGERWRLIQVDLRPDWIGKSIVLVAQDRTSDLGGWLAITEPARGGLVTGINGLLQTLAAWTINGLLLGLLYWAALRVVGSRAWVPEPWLPLIAGGVVAALGYLAFWIYFATPTAGKAYSVTLVLAAVYVAVRRGRREDAMPGAVRHVSRLWLAVGFFYLALLCLFPTARNFYNLAANRLREDLPADNGLPHDVAMGAFRGDSLRPPGAEWLTSDRPPLQSGWQLLTLPWLRSVSVDPQRATGTAALWFQLLWVAAIYGLLATLHMPPRRIAAWVGLLSITGFFAQNTIFTWPKLSAAAFGCGAFALWFLPHPAPRRTATVLGAALAGLAWLSHGGIAFSFLAMAPWLVRSLIRGEWRRWMLATGVFLVLALPWFGFQKLYNPPGDRLIREHLAGIREKDPRPVWTAIRDAYHAESWPEIIDAKIANFRMLTLGHWPGLFDFRTTTAPGRRNDEFFSTFRALTWWLLAAIALPCALFRRQTREDLRRSGRAVIALLAWTALTIVIWCLMMFVPYATCIHQGSYAIMLTLFVLLAAAADWADPRLIHVIAVLQVATFTTTWAVANAHVHGPPTGWPFLAMATLAMVAIYLSAFRASADQGGPVAPESRPSRPDGIAAAKQP
ncbi:MAG TPA: hypothetical protein VHE61_18225 [Opitutaceae bacterium]|nr:hypothetical protein [Opitutaceae bacterium]